MQGPDRSLPRSRVDSHRIGHQFGDVPDRRFYPPPVTHSGDIHGAAGVVADKSIGAGRLDAVDLVFDDCPADGGILDRKGAAESAALIGLFHGLETDIADLAEQADAFIPDADSAEMAGVVICD